MATYDWNNNGKKDIGDNFIEYQIYKDVTGDKNKTTYNSGRSSGMSTLGVIISVVAGLFLQVLLYVLFDIDVEDVPVFVIILLWFVFSTIAAIIADKIGI